MLQPGSVIGDLYRKGWIKIPKTQKIIQSLNGGELSPLMDSRLDINKYTSGCRTMENFIPLIYGGAQERPGLEFIAAQKSSSDKARVVAFEHSVDDTYILLFENQVLRFFKSGAQILVPFGTEDLSDFDSATGDSSLIAHWKCNDNLETTNVIDGTIAGSHDGTAEDNTANYSTADESGTANKAFDLNGTDEFITVTDADAFSFGDGSNDRPFSIAAWVEYATSTNDQTIISKFDPATKDEWLLQVKGTINTVDFGLIDTSVAGTDQRVRTRNGLTDGWHFVVATYDGRGGSSAGEGLKIYVDWVLQSVITVTSGAYIAMENTDSNVIIGSQNVGVTKFWDGSIHNIAMFSKELSAQEIANLVGTDSTVVYEIITSYLTADLLSLKFEQSADVMFITHPSYEPRKLSRLADAAWELEELDLRTGPFRDQNTDTAKTITATAIGGGIVAGASITLTAVGHSPFITGTTAGHLPSGSVATSKSLTGTLFKLVQAVSSTDASISAELDTPTLNDPSATLAVPKGITWDWTTNGTWGEQGNSASVVLERSYDDGTTYETVHTVTSAANKNVSVSGTEGTADAIYRSRVSEANTTSTHKCSTQFSIRDTSHIGIVEITAVTSPQSATATVLATLASTDPTHRFSEGSFSNRRAWPIDVIISSEERLTFAGNVSEPLTIWGSVTGDFTDFKLGTDDDDAVSFTLVGSGQQNRIRWILSKDVSILGTVGGEHLLGASKEEEALTPTNVKAKIQTTHGSEDIKAIIINQAVIFVQRGGKKIREFLFDFDSDSYKAEDLTVFSNEITGDGIVDMAYQRTPDPILWCVRTDGQMAILNYERDQDVFSWSRLVSEGGTSDAEFESVAVIYGGTRSEDEVWVTVKRTINTATTPTTVRYVERFFQRDMPSAIADMKYLDSFITDTGGDTTITGLGHLEGETVQVLGDGLVQATQVVSGSQITAATTAAKYQVGLGYTALVKPMKIDLQGLGLSVTKKINRGVFNFFETIGGEVGTSTSRLHDVPTGTAALFTGSKEIPLSGGYSREGDILARQTQPLPMTILSFTLDIGANKD